MSYLAIARKYRPVTFDEIVGQDHVIRTLVNAIARERIHHAYLFCGARGVGKTTAARALSRALNCIDGPTPKPCGVCTSCKEIALGASPDLIEIDGASNNSVDDIRDLRDTVRYAPTLGKRKIYLVDEVHMLSNAAFNALLKTLEEPPPHVVFIFATTEPNKIPDTILSRVQRFDFKRIALGTVVKRLAEIAAAEGTEIEESGLKLIARSGEGSMRDSESLLDKVISFGGTTITDAMVAETLGLIDRGLLYNMLSGLVRGEAEACLDVIATIYNYGFEMSQFTGDLLEVLRNATFVGLSETARRHVDLAEAEIDQLVAIVGDTPPDVLSRLFSAMLDVHDTVSRSNRPRIVLEMAVARLATVRPVQPVGALVARLEQLERRLRQGGGRPASGGPGRRPSGPARSHHAGRAPVVRAPGAARARSRRTPSAAPPPADASDDDRWASLHTALLALHPPAEHLASGRFRIQGKAVVLTIDGGRSLAAARRSLKAEAVAEVVAAHFPGRPLKLEESLASKREHIDPELERQVLTDPRCQQIFGVLGATLEDIIPIESGEQS